MALSDSISVAFVGFGEAAQAFVTGWRQTRPPDLSSERITAYDIKTDGAEGIRAEEQADYQNAGIRGCDTAAEAVADADVVFSMVTADQALRAACATAESLPPGTLFFDCNSCAPQTKADAAKAVEAAGGRYVDVAVMAPVHPRLHATPVLVSGPHAAAAVAIMERLRMCAGEVPGDVGQASAVKLVRSIMIKGLEALTVECLLAGRRLGVDERVLQSLDASFPDFGWPQRAAYMLERVATHGPRRAAEMREAAAMVDKAGLPCRMTSAAVEWQQQIGDLDLDTDGGDHAAQADAILDAMRIPTVGQRR